MFDPPPAHASTASGNSPVSRWICPRISSEISAWVQENYTPVTIGSTTFYDLTQPLTGTSTTQEG